jgi:hypothetical protein
LVKWVLLRVLSPPPQQLLQVQLLLQAQLQELALRVRGLVLQDHQVLVVVPEELQQAALLEDPVAEAVVTVALSRPSMLLTRNIRTVAEVAVTDGRFGRRSGSTLWTSQQLLLQSVLQDSRRCSQRLWLTEHT